MTKLTIVAVGLRYSDALSEALRIIGMMITSPHENGHSCGGTNGNAEGKLETIAIEQDETD